VAAGANDPWGGATLEWSIPSPPPVYNFSVDPDDREPAAALEDRASRADEGPARRPPAPIHVPGGSWWPLVTAIGSRCSRWRR